MLKISSKNIKYSLSYPDSRKPKKLPFLDTERPPAGRGDFFSLEIFIFGPYYIICQKNSFMASNLKKNVFMGGVPP